MNILYLVDFVPFMAMCNLMLCRQIQQSTCAPHSMLYGALTGADVMVFGSGIALWVLDYEFELYYIISIFIFSESNHRQQMFKLHLHNHFQKLLCHKSEAKQQGGDGNISTVL